MEAQAVEEVLCGCRVEQGWLNLNRVNDLLYTVDFRPYKNEKFSHLPCYKVDLDSIELDDSCGVISIKDSEPYLNFQALDVTEFNLFQEAKQECEAIINLKLTLATQMRDAYFAGIYSNVNPDDTLIVADKVDALRKTQPNLFFKSLTHPSAITIAKGGQKPKRPIKHNLDSASQYLIEDINCLYCSSTKTNNPEQNYYIHPYVSLLFNQKPIFFCKLCIVAWKEYRDNVEHDNELILENEINEEICAFCSDSPATLILCSVCPRSFCHLCLAKALPKELFDTVTEENDVDWVCMCCVNKQIVNPPLHKSVWKLVEASPRSTKDRGRSVSSLAPAQRKTWPLHTTIDSSPRPVKSVGTKCADFGR